MMVARMHRALALLEARLATSHHFAADALMPLNEVSAEHKHFNARQALVEARSDANQVLMIKEGWAYSYIQLDDGSTQITGFLLPGDLIGLDGLAFPTMRFGVTAITPVNAMAFDQQTLNGLLDRHPRLTKQLLMLVCSEFTIIAERLADFGRRSAHQRTLRLLLELYTRLSRVGLARPDGFPFPVTQNLLADAVALTDVHLNRILRRLDQEGLLRVEHRPARYVRILNRDAAVRAAAFDDGYLGDRSPRSKPTL